MSTNTITGKITRTVRMGLSRYGNPYYLVGIEDGNGDLHKVRTQIDSMVNYQIDNKEYKDEIHTFRLTRAGRIYKIDKGEE